MLSVVIGAAIAVTIPTVWLPVIGMLIPVLTAVVTRYRADSKAVPAAVAIIASGVVTVTQSLMDDTPDTTTTLLIGFLMVIGPAVGSYIGFWQPVVKINERAFPKSGI